MNAKLRRHLEAVRNTGGLRVPHPPFPFMNIMPHHGCMGLLGGGGHAPRQESEFLFLPKDPSFSNAVDHFLPQEDTDSDSSLASAASSTSTSSSGCNLSLVVVLVSSHWRNDLHIDHQRRTPATKHNHPNREMCRCRRRQTSAALGLTQYILLKPLLKPLCTITHSFSQANTDPAMYANTPDSQIPLTAKGVEQAKKVGQELRQLVGDSSVVFYVSPLRRTRETFLNIAKAFGDAQFCMTEDPRY